MVDLGMTTITHVFVYTIERSDDPFHGLKQLLLKGRRAHHVVREIRLSATNYATVRQVEYSARKYLRCFYYPPIFRELEELLRESVSGWPSSSHPSVIYFSDEGVWAEFVKDFRQRYSRAELYAVNVQHGFEHAVRPRHRRVRELANTIARRACGYPAFGLGSFGGGGKGVFDVYLTYDEATSRFIREYTGDLSYECPALIKHGLFERYRAARTSIHTDGRVDGVMFALQPKISTFLGPPNIRGTTVEVMRELFPVARLLQEHYGRRLVLRPHPGMDRGKVLDAYHDSGIDRYTDLDGGCELAELLAQCGVVMSFDSTVLWEAGLLGLVPVTIHGKCFSRSLGFPHEIVHTTGDVASDLQRVMSRETAEKYRQQSTTDGFDWEAVVSRLVEEKSGSSGAQAS